MVNFVIASLQAASHLLSDVGSSCCLPVQANSMFHQLTTWSYTHGIVSALKAEYLRKPAGSV